MKILVYRLGSLGDTLLALPCFRAIRTKFPEAHISLLTNVPVNGKAAPTLEILAHTGTVDEVLEYPKGSRNPSALLALVCRLRGRDFDLAVHLAAARGWGASVRDLTFLKLAGAKKIVGVPFATEDLHPTKVREGVWEWEAERLARRVRPIVSVDLRNPATWDLALTTQEQSEAHDLLADNESSKLRWIAASVGTKSDVKDWTESNWLALVKRLGGEYSDRGLVMMGVSSEWERSERCLAQWPGKRLNLCGKTSARVSAAVLEQAELFIGHDSGPMHMAAVVGTPCIAIFAARNFPGQWFPRGGDSNRVLYHRTECFGCGLEVCTHYAKKCILSISVDEVEQAVQNILGSTAKELQIRT